MQLYLLEKLGDGQFGDVWRAKDELDREVAVKIIRPASVGVADALAHAKALARASHPNVVSVITLEKIPEPESGDLVDCVVMELLNGDTLTQQLSKAKFSIAEASSIGAGIVDGLSHIHTQRMTHGDLHSDNVMIVDSVAKVIDILYLNTLALVSTERRDLRLKRDLISLRLLLQQIISNCEIDPAEATEFNNLLDVDASCADMKLAFLRILNPEITENISRSLEHAYSRVIDPDFIEGEAYAAALAEETKTELLLSLLKRVVDERAYLTKHGHYVQALWTRLPQTQRAELLLHLSSAIDNELPKGNWSPLIRLLSLLKEDGWNGLTKLCQLRLEGLITKDVLAGRKDINSVIAVSGGALGTYALSLWTNFKRPDLLADNLVPLLRQNWYTQNYVGGYFMRVIPRIAAATNKRTEFIAAFRIAVSNDARLVKNKLEELPTDWVAEIRAKDIEF
jgi:hypothetical protein